MGRLAGLGDFVGKKREKARQEARKPITTTDPRQYQEELDKRAWASAKSHMKDKPDADDYLWASEVNAVAQPANKPSQHFYAYYGPHGANLDTMKQLTESNPDFIRTAAAKHAAYGLSDYYNQREDAHNRTDPARASYMAQKYAELYKQYPISFGQYGMPTSLEQGIREYQMKDTPEGLAAKREADKKANAHTQGAYEPAWTPSPQGVPAVPQVMAHQAHADMAARMPRGQHRTLRDTWGADDVAGNGRLLGSIMSNAEAQQHAQGGYGIQDVNRSSLPDLERAYEEARAANNTQRMTDIARRIYAIDPYAAHAVR